VSNGAYRIGGGLLPDAVKFLLIWNGILYLLKLLLDGGIGFLGADLLVRVDGQSVLYPLRRIEQLLGIVPLLVWQKGFLWQLVTYMFVHGGLFHILFNMFALWMFGSDLERLWGARRFLSFYFFCGIGAGLLTLIVTPHAAIPTVGASGAIYGILLAYAIYFPHRRILFYFLIPVPVRIFVIIIGLIAFVNSLASPGSGIAHVAHLGGMVFGWLYLKGLHPGRWFRRWSWGRRRRGMRVIDFTRDKDDRFGGGGR